MLLNHLGLQRYFQGKLGLPETFDGPDIVHNKVKLMNVSYISLFIIEQNPQDFIA